MHMLQLFLSMQRKSFPLIQYEVNFINKKFTFLIKLNRFIKSLLKRLLSILENQEI
jgi:hypothetical protein